MDVPQELRDKIIDEEHLRLLSLGHYIHGGLCIAFATLFIFHFAFILVMAANPDMFAAAGTHPRQSVMACLNTLFIPFGTVLGVFTLVVLSRPSVKRLYRL